MSRFREGEAMIRDEVDAASAANDFGTARIEPCFGVGGHNGVVVDNALQNLTADGTGLIVAIHADSLQRTANDHSGHIPWRDIFVSSCEPKSR
jgi:hypothetical protein